VNCGSSTAASIPLAVGKERRHRREADAPALAQKSGQFVGGDQPALAAVDHIDIGRQVTAEAHQRQHGERAAGAADAEIAGQHAHARRVQARRRVGRIARRVQTEGEIAEQQPAAVVHQPVEQMAALVELHQPRRRRPHRSGKAGLVAQSGNGGRRRHILPRRRRRTEDRS
jgi:hypothetical protein